MLYTKSPYSTSSTIKNKTNEQTLTTTSKNYNYMEFKERFYNMFKKQLLYIPKI